MLKCINMTSQVAQYIIARILLFESFSNNYLSNLLYR